MLKSHVPKLLKDHNLTAYGLAVNAGIKQGQARKLRDGALPSTHQLERLCRYFELPVEAIVSYESSEPVAA